VLVGGRDIRDCQGGGKGCRMRAKAERAKQNVVTGDHVTERRALLMLSLGREAVSVGRK
jgi:hypothetical protein